MTRAHAAPRPSVAALLLAAACLLGVSAGVQVVRDRGWRPYHPPNPMLWVSSRLASPLSLGFRNLVADLYWMRAVVYYGSQRRAEGQQNFDLLYPLLDLTTTLDPRFRVAYRFGAIFLTEAYPSGAGRPDLAIALLKRGLEHQPDGWEYAHDIGFVHYWWMRDYQGAADWFRRASSLPGAPSWLGPLAAVTMAEGGNRESSRQMWRQMLETGDVDWVKRSAERRLLQLDAMDAIDRLNVLLEQFLAKHGRPARHWQEVVASFRLRGVPLDPAGVPYAIDAMTGTAGVDEASPLSPLPSVPTAGPSRTP
ncbi:MAG: hypothetical protein ABR606_14765 [Vicinamibacterales bacterium]